MNSPFRARAFACLAGTVAMFAVVAALSGPLDMVPPQVDDRSVPTCAATGNR